MIKIINKYYEPEIKEVRCIVAEDELNNLLQEIERLNNIINELEKWLNEIKYVGVEKYDVDIDVLLDKIQELKGVDKE